MIYVYMFILFEDVLFGSWQLFRMQLIVSEDFVVDSQ